MSKDPGREVGLAGKSPTPADGSGVFADGPEAALRPGEGRAETSGVLALGVVEPRPLMAVPGAVGPHAGGGDFRHLRPRAARGSEGVGRGGSGHSGAKPAPRSP